MAALALPLSAYPGLRRFARNWAALGSLVYVAGLTLVALLAPWLSPYPYDYQNSDQLLAPVSFAHWMGTDDLGRDLFSRLIYGARVSVSVAYVSTLFSLLLGTTYGALSGYVGGRLDHALMRVVDVVYSFPDLLLIILINTAINREWLLAVLSAWWLLWARHLVNAETLALLLALSLVSWVTVARLIRGEVLRLREETYVEAARALGVGHGAILFRHILPNTWGPLIVTLTFRIPAVILAESTLSFIGLGIQPPKSSWGTLAADGWTALRFQPHLIIFPSLAIFLTMLAFNFLGDGLRDALDPRLRKR
ncbi:MAG: peptide ABC transporter permease [Deltaproteobacteria bacterium RBG_13_61_14]|nr:MAG: peptide ABC transporter permease [Deltaproteobacteria bacterium RBG_13_61_14]